MAVRSRQEATAITAAYDFGGFRRLVDVGGGHGILLSTILAATPSLRGVLFDRPEVVDRAHENLRADGMLSRCDVVAGDFFASVPAGGDAYLLSRVIHDWDDAASIRILATCREAMPDHARLVLIEAVMSQRARAAGGGSHGLAHAHAAPRARAHGARVPGIARGDAFRAPARGSRPSGRGALCPRSLVREPGGPR
jgi:hypothetical protein